MKISEKIKKRNGGLNSYAEFYGSLIYPVVTGASRNRINFGNKEMISWSFNDYLGFSSDERATAVETETVEKYGANYPAGSRLLTGNTVFHEELEGELQKLLGKPTMLYNLGYAGIVSTIQSLLDRNDVVVYDQQVHACLLDGTQLHKGERRSFQHNDMDHLEKQLKKAHETKNANGDILVIVDGVYSMSGDTSMIKTMIDLKKKYPFTLLVDDSHGFLVFGNHGSVGKALMGEVDIYISTFTKALSSYGGFVAAEKSIIDHFKYNLRSQVFGKSLPLLNVNSVLCKLKLNKLEGDDRRAALWGNTRKLQSALTGIGMNIGNTCSPITPVYLDCPTTLSIDLIQQVRSEYGIFCSGVTYPVIPKGKVILRLIATAIHTDQDISKTTEAFKDITVGLGDGLLNLSSHRDGKQAYQEVKKTA